jgi:hypothetical protein
VKGTVNLGGMVLSGETDLIMFNNTGRLKMRSKIGDTCKSDRYLP